MFKSAVLWAQEYGDVLGSIGFLFALSTVLITNGRVIYDRFKKNDKQTIANSTSDHATTGASTSSESDSFTPEYGDKIAIGVLPPKLLGQVDPDFSIGLVDDIIADLQQAGFIAPEFSSVSKLMSMYEEPLVVAKELKVKFVLKSSIRFQSGKYRVSIQLIDFTGVIIWSKRYDNDDDDLMRLQEEIALKVAKDTEHFLQPVLPESEKKHTLEIELNDGTTFSRKSRLIALLLSLPPMGLFWLSSILCWPAFHRDCLFLYLGTGAFWLDHRYGIDSHWFIRRWQRKTCMVLATGTYSQTRALNDQIAFLT